MVIDAFITVMCFVLCSSFTIIIICLRFSINVVVVLAVVVHVFFQLLLLLLV